MRHQGDCGADTVGVIKIPRGSDGESDKQSTELTCDHYDLCQEACAIANNVTD